jgi:hypothetical protein
MTRALPPQITGWFDSRGWSIHPHQHAMLARADAPCQLLIAPTGGGKTMAGFLPSLAELADGTHQGLHTLYVSPLKALAADIKRNLTGPITEMGLPIRSKAAYFIEVQRDKLFHLKNVYAFTNSSIFTKHFSCGKAPCRCHDDWAETIV